ncbi:MAG: diacylglycerol kinase family lipid kinase [Enhydrobacter sp.]|nr:MAG: diacylglycerol kinase family lipid kinase [Enhydrobacter sp.]
MPKAVLMIRNPTAGRCRRGLVDDVVRRLRAEGWTVDLVDTEARGDAARLAAACDASRYGVLAVAGGDGTINEAVNGLASRTARGPSLAIVPLGTANVLAHELGLSPSARTIVRAIVAGEAIDVAPGLARDIETSRCFTLMAGVGFDAKVVAGVGARLKRRLGRGAYVWRSLVEMLRYRPIRYSVEVDGVASEAASAIVTRSRHYAGPYVVARGASLGEPMLHVCLFERWGRLQVLRFGAALLTGRLQHMAGYRVVTGRRVEIRAIVEPGREPVQIDGDDALGLPLSIGLAPATVRLLHPRPGDDTGGQPSKPSPIARPAAGGG